uniref:Olfactory receptor n=1 Tax=Rousettus aegyptiacus TaxID=9407 RepID=A0A7J8BFM2_ROUAE|nr:olfactory receptor family 6 subfamily K member 6 [Rousettus aegyptiacus]
MCKKVAYYSLSLLIIYGFIIIGNLMIFIVIQLDMGLDTPMYFFISVLSFLEIWYSTTTIPKILSSLVNDQKTISLAGCLMQMYFFHSLGITEGCVLTVMAIDRYIAICHPLRYPTIMTSKLCTQLTAGSCFCGFLLVLPEIVWIATLPFCGSNEIRKIFCDFTPVLSFACRYFPGGHCRCHTCGGDFGLLLGHCLVLHSDHHGDSEGRCKAFFTCAAHLAVFLLFVGSVAVIYLRFSTTYSVFLDTVIAITFVILAPFLNPIIYSLRNKDMKDAIGRLFCYQKRAGGFGNSI